MTDIFKAVDFEGFSPIAKAIGEFPSIFCDHTPYVILAWQKYYNSAFAVIKGHPILCHTVDKKHCYAPLTSNVTDAATALLDNADSICLSLLTEEQVKCLCEKFRVSDIECDEGWADYIYLHSDLASFKGKRFSGQRNHINKFLSSCKEWSYEEISKSNLREVLEFYKELTADTAGMDETALYEKKWLTEYLSGYFYRLSMSGGLIRADGKIVSFAFGEVIRNTLYVHVEKARRDIPGAYQMIVREFAAHNPAELINREEDMGIEGLRTSKRSYHPIRLEKKYKLRVYKNDLLH